MLTILNVYAPCSSDKRAQIWRRINQAALISNHYILGGDFNHLEVIDHRGTAGVR
jgi:hypothetical protein